MDGLSFRFSTYKNEWRKRNMIVDMIFALRFFIGVLPRNIKSEIIKNYLQLSHLRTNLTSAFKDYSKVLLQTCDAKLTFRCGQHIVSMFLFWHFNERIYPKSYRMVYRNLNIWQPANLFRKKQTDKLFWIWRWLDLYENER